MCDRQSYDSATVTEDEAASLQELATVTFHDDEGNIVLVFGEQTREAGYAILYANEPAYICYDEVAAPYVRGVKEEFHE